MTSPASWRCDPRRLSRLLLILGSAVTLVEGSPGETRAADSHVEAIAKKIAWQTETRKSVELRVRTTIAISHPPPAVPGSFDTCEEHYIEMAGKRRCDLVNTSAGRIVSHEAHFWNGSKAAAVKFAAGPARKFDIPATVTVNRSYFKEDAGERMERPNPILFLHVGRESLHKALLKAKPMGTGTALGRECDLFLFEQVRWRVPQDQLYYLDRETGIPLRVEGFPNYADKDKQKWHWIWRAESLEKVGKFYIPFKTVQIHFVQNQPAYTWTSTVQSAEFDKDFPASLFWPAAAPGQDSSTQSRSRRCAAFSRRVTRTSSRGPTPHGRRNRPSPSLGADGAAGVSMGAGALLLVAGVVVGCLRQGRIGTDIEGPRGT